MYVLHYAPDNASLIVRLVLDGAGIPYRTALVDRTKRQQDSAAYRALNPTGLIPTLETPLGPIPDTGALLLWLSDTHQLGPAPGHPDHPDHRPGLPEQPEPPLNQRRAQAGGFADPQLAALLAALRGDDDDLISRRWAEVADSPAMQAFIAQGQEALAARDRALHGQLAREVQDPALPRA